MYKKILTPLPLLFSGLLPLTESKAQFAPAAGQPGTTAMYKDSSAFIDWASACTITRGWQNIDNTASGYASGGDSTMATGAAGTAGVVSLGDGGVAICRFNTPIRNGVGFDFAVFENSFSDFFLELAFVEVSSDGITYVRFPATSYRQDTVQADSFDTEGNPEQINNLAGKYRGMFGTPFDLEELNGVSGIDVTNINYVKIIDVVGSINQTYASVDQYGTKINDPWPTEFPTGGFDLDAVGVINNQLNAIDETSAKNPFGLYPNPNNGIVYFSGEIPGNIAVYDLNGKMVLQKNKNLSVSLDVTGLEKGIYFISLSTGEKSFFSKLVRN